MTLSDWKSLEITDLILTELKRRQEEAKEKLASIAGLDPLRDRWLCGAIAAYEDVLNIELDGEVHGD